jgi:hypothetical protein
MRSETTRRLRSVLHSAKYSCVWLSANRPALSVQLIGQPQLSREPYLSSLLPPIRVHWHRPIWTQPQPNQTMQNP